MRIVHVVRQYRPSVGGLESVVEELCVRQVAHGHDVRVVTLDRLINVENAPRLPARETIAGVDVVRIPFVGPSRYPIAPTVLRYIGNADVVHVHAIDFFFDYLAATKALHRRRLVVSTHGGFFHTQFAARTKQAYFKSVTRMVMRAYAGVVAVSIADFERFHAIRRRGMTCIENGVDINKYADAGSIAPRKAILVLGRFSTNKRIDRMVEFLAHLRAQDPAWTMTIAGRPWDQNSADIAAMAERAGVSGAVTIRVSPSEADIRALMSDCSLFVSASEHEGFGIAAVEAMSAGLIGVLSDIAAYRAIVRQTLSGLILDFSLPKVAASRLLREWPRIEGDYAQLRAQAIAAARRYDWEGVSRNYLRLYDDIRGTRERAILDVAIQPATLDEATATLDTRLDQRARALVAFANAHTLNIAATDGSYRATLRDAIVFNDGLGADIASRILYGAVFPENLNGTDFVPNYLARTKRRLRIYLLGAAPGVAWRVEEKLARRVPHHIVVGTRHGYFSDEETPEVVEQVRASGANVLLVAMGNPRQELWLKDNLDKTGCILGFGVGALFDFLTGEATRAPQWIRRARLEWCYRMVREPRRLGARYIAGNPVFILRLAQQWWSGARILDTGIDTPAQLSS